MRAERSTGTLSRLRSNGTCLRADLSLFFLCLWAKFYRLESYILFIPQILKAGFYMVFVPIYN
jgi:hypothetical protein